MVDPVQNKVPKSKEIYGTEEVSQIFQSPQSINEAGINSEIVEVEEKGIDTEESKKIETLNTLVLESKENSFKETDKNRKKTQYKEIKKETIPSIIDYSAGAIPHHTLNSTDPLTNEADLKEEEFIDNVEAAHDKS